MAKIKGSKGVINLSETAPGSGIYRFLYRIKPGDNFKDSEISVTLENKKGRKSIVASGKISKLEPDSFWQAEVSADNAVVRSGYALTPADKAGYVLFPPQGTKFLVTGRRGQELEVRLNQARSGWIGETEVRPAGHSTPRITSGNLIVSYQKPNSLLRLYLGAKPPFEVTASPAEDKIDIRFFGVVSNTDWINYESTSSIISFVEWFQDDTETFRVTLHLKETNWWGYDARFENGSFVFEIRRPEKIPAADSTLKGIMVAIDAGHGPETGAVGPTGLEEKNVNLSIALSLEKMLLAQGAEVTMIRRGNEPVSLYDRIRKAQNIKADMLISIHNNALPEGQNPLVKNGFGAYYYYPQSFALAQEIHDSLAKAFSSSYSKYPLRDDGLYYGNLALARVPQMPAVLVECAYIIVPREESLLRNAGFQNACAQAITSGIKKFVAAKKKRK
ncbi:MAG: hypothetical protein A2386_08795 [Elusimicrobia bacterium RIFOXYB1_FULL_48_9]|nr:MAG: hypothetical protein A2386_08795 [Elusimicrobia bacterium RIFOXYB1_FULL_48_9]